MHSRQLSWQDLFEAVFTAWMNAVLRCSMWNTADCCGNLNLSLSEGYGWPVCIGCVVLLGHETESSQQSEAVGFAFSPQRGCVAKGAVAVMQVRGVIFQRKQREVHYHLRTYLLLFRTSSVCKAELGEYHLQRGDPSTQPAGEVLRQTWSFQANQTRVLRWAEAVTPQKIK